MSGFVSDATVDAYLDTLRESGAVNMFGAAPYLAYMFDVDIHNAKCMLKGWMTRCEEKAK